MGLLATLLAVLAVCEAASTDLHWLPLGDSITWGCGTDATPRGRPDCAPDAGGYRIPLAWALSQAGYNVSTMGTLTTGPEYVPTAWKKHDGHPGWRYDQIDALLNTSLKTSRTPPDLVTIHLGTNDCGQGPNDVALIGSRMNSLLRHVFASVPQAHVFVASMIGFPGEAVCAAAVNALLPPAIASLKTAGMKVVYVPMQEQSGICVANMTDPLSGLCCSGRVHPTAAGYLRMASAFALSIAEYGPVA